MKTGVDQLLDAIDSGKRIVIYGDYDVDGITSTSLLMKVIGTLTDNVTYYIPSRLDEGYGLHRESIDRINEDGGEFIRWEFQCEYDVVSGTVQNDVSYDKVVVLRPKSDIHGIAYFKAKDEPSEKPTEAPKKPDDGKTSPKTGYPLLFVFGAMGLALVAGIAVTKKMKG